MEVFGSPAVNNPYTLWSLLESYSLRFIGFRRIEWCFSYMTFICLVVILEGY